MGDVSRLLILIALAASACPSSPRRQHPGSASYGAERLEEGRHPASLDPPRWPPMAPAGSSSSTRSPGNVLYGPRITYHVSDGFGIGITASGPMASTAIWRDRIESERPERAKQGTFGTVRPPWHLDFQFTSLIGKFALVRSAGLQLRPARGRGHRRDPGRRRHRAGRPAHHAGGRRGLRAFVTDAFARTWRCAHYLYSASTNSVPNADSGAKPVATDASFQPLRHHHRRRLLLPPRSLSAPDSHHASSWCSRCKPPKLLIDPAGSRATGRAFREPRGPRRVRPAFTHRDSLHDHPRPQRSLFGTPTRRLAALLGSNAAFYGGGYLSSATSTSRRRHPLQLRPRLPLMALGVTAALFS
ncbi:MAG: hypothetical protein R3F43_08755 [bacterium]